MVGDALLLLVFFGGLAIVSGIITGNEGAIGVGSVFVIGGGFTFIAWPIIWTIYDYWF